MIKKKLKYHVFVVDAFGPCPIISFQHPVKESLDGYLMGVEALKKDKWLKELKKLDKKTNDYDMFVDCTIEYEKHKEYGKIIHKIIDVEEIHLCPEFSL